jgi:LacI family transcriptional regulator
MDEITEPRYVKRMATRRRIPQVLLLIETSRAYGRGLVEGIAQYAEENGPWSIQFEERGLTDPLPRGLGSWPGDGIISRSTHKRGIARLLATGLPVVELYAYHGATFPNVRPDETAVSRLAVEHFLDRGLRNFAFFCTNRVHWSADRGRLFERTVRERGFVCHRFSFEPLQRRSGGKICRGDDRQVIRWLRKLPKPCGVLCASDFFAARLIPLCRSCGISVPEQIAVLGVDNDPVFCGTCLPRLSSIDLGSPQIGYQAAALLDRLMSGRSPSKRSVCVMPNRVFTRESTDILAIDDEDVVQAVKLIREQACCRALHVTEVASAIGLSCRTLEQRFRRFLHRSPKDEILRVRMEQAEAMLSAGGHTVAKVAKMTGFTSPKYFARAFRKRTGMSPQTYRKRKQKGRID